MSRTKTLPPTSGPLEPLEPRRLLSSYTFENFAEGLGLHATLLDRIVLGPIVSLANIGDVDGDGADDVVAGVARFVAGRAAVISGRSGVIRLERADGEAEFGFAVVGLGDVSGDGTPDFAVGSPTAWTHGRVSIYSGDDGVRLHELAAPVLFPNPDTIPDRFGHALASPGDVDADGVPDILIGAPGGGPDDQGAAYIFSGATGTHLRTFLGASHGDEFGFAVAGAGPLPGVEATIGVLIGAPGTPDPEVPGSAGAAYLYAAAAGDLLDTFSGTQAGARLGHAVAATRSPATVFLHIGAPDHDALLPGGGDTPAADVGRILTVDVLSSPPAHLDGAAAGARFGANLATLGDVDRDGATDLAAGAPGSGTILVRLSGGHNAPDPGVLAAGADINGDGLTDLVTAAPTAPGYSDGPGRFLGRSYPDFLPLGSPGVASPNLNFVVFPGDGFLVERGVRATSLADIPGLDGADIVTINDHGHILADDFDGSPFILIDGQRTDIPAGVTQAVGATLTDGPFTGMDIGNDGQVLLQQTLADRTISWAFKDGVLTFLWNGFVSEINASGAVLGTRLDPGQAFGTTVLRAADGAVTEIPGLFNAFHLADDNAVLGIEGPTGAQRLVIWQAGVLTPVADLPQGSAPTMIDLATGLRAAFTIHPPGAPRYFDPSSGNITVRSLITNPEALPDPVALGRPVPEAIAPDGTILTSEGVLVPIDPAELTRPAPGAPLIPLAAGDTITTITLNTLGQLMAARTDAAGPLGATRILNTTNSQPIHVGDRPFTAFVDPRDGRMYAVVTTPDGAALYVLTEDAAEGTFTRNLTLTAPDGSSETPWASDLITFTSADGDGRVHLAGRHASGDWIMFYQNGPADQPGGGWAVSNLTTDHLAPEGLTIPALTGVTAYITPWNALNIIGIDPTGDVHALWWAPGLVTDTSTGRWRTDNLTRAARDQAARLALPLTIPKLQGNLTAFVTPWNAIHIAGATTGEDATPEPKPVGEIGVLWWAPNLGAAWAADVLKNVPHEGGGGSPSFVPGSLTSLVTPWGGLAIFGVAATQLSQPGLDIDPGEIAVFWWSAPAGGGGIADTWNLASLSDDVILTPPGPTVTPPLAALATPAGAQHLFTTHTSTGALLSFSWTPSTPTWTFTPVPFTFLQL